MLSIWQRTGLSCKDEAHRRQVSLFWEILDETGIELRKIHTKENPVDILTKIVPGVKFKLFKKLFHILPVA